MLPLDSPRWSALTSSIGNGQESAESLQRLKPLLLQHDRPTFAQEFDELWSIVEDLDHQQSTYPATTAAMPHFVEIAQELPLQFQVQLLSLIAMMHYDGAGQRTKETDLLQWYQDSIAKATNLNESILVGDAELGFGQQITMLESAYLFNGDYHYMFREHDWFEYACPECNEPLVAAFHQDEFWVWQESDGRKFDDVTEDRRCQVQPTPNVEASIKVAENQELGLALDYAKQGNRQAAIEWLHRLMGVSACPKCGKQIRLAYNDFWFRKF